MNFLTYLLKGKGTVWYFTGDRGGWYCSYKPIIDYIDEQFEAYLQEELKVKRSLHTYHDTRVHACLYFLAPTGHS